MSWVTAHPSLYGHSACTVDGEGFMSQYHFPVYFKSLYNLSSLLHSFLEENQLYCCGPSLFSVTPSAGTAGDRHRPKRRKFHFEGELLFSVSVGKCRIQLLRELVDYPSSEVFKARLDVVLTARSDHCHFEQHVLLGISRGPRRRLNEPVKGNSPEMHPWSIGCV